MKTVEEKAKEYAKKTIVLENRDSFSNEANLRTAEYWVYKAYLAGYNEAMRWRDPEEELPEFNKEDYLNGDYKRYLIMVVEGSISTRRYVTVGWLISANRWNVEMDWVSVIGWRPIK